jgi:RNA polymerase sigma factor (sigma-70 family)
VLQELAPEGDAMAAEELLEALFRTPGRDWSAEARETVLHWLVEQRSTLVQALVKPVHRRDTDPHLTEEVVNDFLSRASQQLERYDPAKARGGGCPFRAWVAAILATNYRRARHRHSQKRQRETKALRSKQAELPGPSSARPSAPTEDLPRENLDQLRPYFARLPPRQREAIELRLSYPSYKEMARAAACTEVAIRVRYHRAIKTLTRLMRDQGPMPAVPSGAAEQAVDFVPRPIATRAEFDALWIMDRSAYERVQREVYAESMYEVLRGWWEAYSSGLIGLYRNAALIGFLGAWPITPLTADRLRTGRLRECELDPWPGGSEPICHVYVGGIFLSPAFRATMAVRYLVRDCFSMFLARAPQLRYPLEVLAQAASAPGEQMLRRFEFQLLRPADEMPDHLALYGLSIKGRGELMERVVMRG